MPLQVTFSGVKLLEEGVWITELNVSEIELLSGGKRKKKPIMYSIILVEGARYNNEDSSLSVNLSGTEALCIGQTDRALLIQKNALSEGMIGASEMVDLSGNIKSSGVSNFLKECEGHDLPKPLTEALEKLLRELYEESHFKLIEGEQRKWTADPNFIALTIQNRNRKVLVSVKGNPSRLNYSSIKPKVSRPPYCEFHFESPEQLAEVLDVARKSRTY